MPVNQMRRAITNTTRRPAIQDARMPPIRGVASQFGSCTVVPAWPRAADSSRSSAVGSRTTDPWAVARFEDAAGCPKLSDWSKFRFVRQRVQVLSEATRAASIPLIVDLGSGKLSDFQGLEEPRVSQVLHAGAEVVTFSGDKLLGGPQAGIVVGKKELVSRLERHPLARAVRIDKLGLAALTATLLHYLKDEATSAIPIWRMIASSSDDLKRKAARWKRAIGSN
ncbi:MAG: hypothetical protein IID42_02440, partial [Planctomycetes bacterium]|nr:hypothetical protein [Planctomycetota bacterium]